MKKALTSAVMPSKCNLIISHRCKFKLSNSGKSIVGK